LKVKLKASRSIVICFIDTVEAILVKYVAAINMDNFDADAQPNMLALKEYCV